MENDRQLEVMCTPIEFMSTPIKGDAWSSPTNPHTHTHTHTHTQNYGQFEFLCSPMKGDTWRSPSDTNVPPAQGLYCFRPMLTDWVSYSPDRKNHQILRQVFRQVPSLIILCLSLFCVFQLAYLRVYLLCKCARASERARSLLLAGRRWRMKGFRSCYR